MEYQEDKYLLEKERTETELRIILCHYYSDLSIVDSQLNILLNDTGKLKDFLARKDIMAIRQKINNPKRLEQLMRELPETY